MNFPRALVPAVLLIALSVTPAGVASADVAQRCAPRGEQQLDIVDGQLTCDAAYDIAAAYDPAGEKYQTIQGFTCYTGNAMTKPEWLSCVSGETDFAVNELNPAG
jgi:hypothetical protein